jgi:hypothetical protein
MRNRFYLPLLSICLLAAACQQPQKPVVTAPVVEKKPELMPPFRFHKLIEVSPGNDFDIVSWGRGATTKSSFLILHSDSTNNQYVTTTGDLDGAIVDVYNTDMDMDGNPEILIQAKATDTANYATIYAFEFNNDKANKLDFPKLTKSQRQGYRGSDNFYIQDGKFMREFPIYGGNTKDAKPTGQKRLLQYGLRNNEFTVEQVSKDSAATTSTPASKPATPSTETKRSSSKKSPSSEKKSSKKKKHHSEEHTSSHHKKKKKHHHSEE